MGIQHCKGGVSKSTGETRWRSVVLDHRGVQEGSAYLRPGPAFHQLSVYLVLSKGKVKVSRMKDDGRQVVVDIYQPDEFFGESALLNLPHRSEQAVALDNTSLMGWSAAEIEDMVAKRPRLAWRCCKS